MRITLLSLCRKLGVAPRIWMLHNPFKIYEFGRLLEGVELKSTDTILDFGCGPGVQTFELARRCKFAMGLDISDRSIATARRYAQNSKLKDKTEFICNGLEAIAQKDIRFDHIFSFCVLEHIEDLNKILSLFSDLLKKNGQIHISVDSLGGIEKDVKEIHRHDHFVVQYFDKKLLANRLTDTGFGGICVFPIMTGEFARREFKKRIIGPSYQINILQRFKYISQFTNEDDASASEGGGIMVIVHANKQA